jgi:hypothetical protein
MVEQLNPNFKGFVKYDWLRQRKITTNTTARKYLFRSINNVVMLAFIMGNFATYFYLKKTFSEAGDIAMGFILSASTGTFNTCYTFVLNRIVERENHKYLSA